MHKCFPQLTVLATVALLLLPTGAAISAELVIAEQGKCEYQIVVPNASPTPAIGDCLKQTARLIQTALKANGADVPIVAEAERDAKRGAILLGDTDLALGQKLDLAGLKGWGYVHRVVGRDVIIAGRDQPSPDQKIDSNDRRPKWDRIGTAKGVADFLRQYVGTRFLYPDLAPYQSVKAAAQIDLLATPAIEYLPTARIAVPADLNVRFIPSISFHTAHPPCGAFYDLAHNRFPLVDDVFGGHTYERAIPAEKYRDVHPEYFALIGGERTGNRPGNAQYCISNPEVQELIYQDMIGWLDRGYQVVDLGQPDGFRPCQCEACAKLFDTGKDWSEKLWLLHRQLAERVNQARPGKEVTIMSYILTALPPKSFQKLPPNTIVMLTGTNEEDIAPWRKCEVPGGFSSYIYNWCPNLGTRYTPMRTPRYVESQAKRLATNRIRSIYRDGPGSLFGLEGPVYYTMGRMFDDPEQNRAKDLVNEFCEASFGRSAVAMLSFYDQLYHGIELYSEHLGTRSPAWSYETIDGRRRKYLTDPFQFLGFLYTPNLLAALETQLAQAEQLANSDKIKIRLALVRREFDYLKALARVVHLHQAYHIQPDLASRDRLLDAIDARNALIAGYFDVRGRTKPTPPWAYVTFPPVGHDANHMRLAHNGYQEPYENTAFNWDTKAMRTAPLPGAKRLTLRAAVEKLGIDSPQWSKTESAALGGFPPGERPTNKTTVQGLFDANQIYFRIESELAAAGNQPESIAIYLAPGQRDLAYRFSIGPDSATRQDAATGLISDPLDPRYGKFDADWSGDWAYESRVDAARHRWLALVAIPYKSFGAQPPRPGDFWRGNFSRVSGKTDGAARSIWSVGASGKSMEDLNDFGEIVFGAPEPAKQASSAKPTLQELREELYRTSFEIPADWRKLPNPLPALKGPWHFCKDPLERGVKQSWFASETPAAGWTPIRVPSFWAEDPAIGKYEGDAWYRTAFEVPEAWKGRAIRLYFAGVDEQAWIYVNGTLVREHTESSEGKSLNELWETPFIAEVTPAQLRYGSSNVLAVRVHNSLANGGIWRPVLIHAVESK